MSKLSIPEQHQLKIAKATLKMSPVMARVMGGPSIEQSIEIIRRLTNKETV
jgi:hypothetical protein